MTPRGSDTAFSTRLVNANSFVSRMNIIHGLNDYARWDPEPVSRPCPTGGAPNDPGRGLKETRGQFNECGAHWFRRVF